MLLTSNTRCRNTPRGSSTKPVTDAIVELRASFSYLRDWPCKLNLADDLKQGICKGMQSVSTFLAHKTQAILLALFAQLAQLKVETLPRLTVHDTATLASAPLDPPPCVLRSVGLSPRAHHANRRPSPSTASESHRMPSDTPGATPWCRTRRRAGGMLCGRRGADATCPTPVPMAATRFDHNSFGGARVEWSAGRTRS